MAQIIDLGKIRFNWAGTYNPATEYSYNDMVKYGPNLYAYTASIAAAGVVPTTTATWAVVTEGIFYKGTYANGALYYRNDVVTDGTNTYIVLTQHTASSAVALGNANLEIIALGQQGLPSQSGNTNKILSTDGTAPQWTATPKLTKGYVGNAQGQAAFDYETSAALTNTMSVFSSSASDFAQFSIVNTTNSGSASTDFISYTADGNNNSGWIDMGITSATFDSEAFGITGPHDGYIFMSAPKGDTERAVVSYTVVAGNQVTLTTSLPHGYSVGNTIIVTGVSESVDGKYVITAIPTTAKLTYTKTATSIAETAVSDATVHRPSGEGNLVLATDGTGSVNSIVFAAGGYLSGRTQMQIIPDTTVHIEIDTESTSSSTGALVVAGGIGSAGNINIAGDLNVVGQVDFSGVNELPIGPGAAAFAATLTNPTITAVTDHDDYAQIAHQNVNDAPNASTDIIMYSDNGTDNSGYIDMGVTSSTFNDPDFTITGPNDGYIFMVAPETFTETVTNKALTSNVATLTVGANDFRVGMPVTVTGVDATFNGTYTITAVTGTTFSYAKTAANVASTAASGTAVAGTTGAGNLVLATGDTGTENKIIFAAGGLSSDATQMEITPGVNVHIEIPTASTSPTTGALTVVGGVGIQGDVNIQGSIVFGGEGTQVGTANLAVTAPFIFTGDGNTTQTYDLGVVTEGKYVLSALPSEILVNKALTSNVATLTTKDSHFFAVGDSVTVTAVDATFDGTYTITAVPNNTNFSYAKVASNVASTRIGDDTFSINQKSRAADTATLQTSAAHNYDVGDTVVVTGVDSTFNGTFTITAVNVGLTTFSYANPGIAVTAEAVSPTGTAVVNTSVSGAVVSAPVRTRYNAIFKDATDKVTKFVSNISTEPVEVIDLAQATYGTADIVYDTIQVGGIINVGTTVNTSTTTLNDDLILASTADIAVNTNKFNVTAATGNTTIAGTVGITGNLTLTNDLIGGALTDIAINTNKFTVAGDTGNTVVAGTLSAQSTSTYTGLATYNGGLTVASGQTLTSSGTLTATGAANFTGVVDVQELREAVVEVTLASGTTGTLDWATGNIFYVPTAPTGAMTFNVTNVPTDINKIMTINVFVVQGATGRIPSTFQIAGTGQTIRWPGGTAPTPTSTAGKIDIFSFTLQRTSGGAWIVYGSSSLNY